MKTIPPALKVYDLRQLLEILEKQKDNSCYLAVPGGPNNLGELVSYMEIARAALAIINKESAK